DPLVAPGGVVPRRRWDTSDRRGPREGGAKRPARPRTGTPRPHPGVARHPVSVPPGSARGVPMPEPPALPLPLWVTGSPVPPAERRAGSFADMIRNGVGGAWGGAWSIVDTVAESAPLPGPDAVAGVIVTGSPARIADQLPWMRRVQH